MESDWIGTMCAETAVAGAGLPAHAGAPKLNGSRNRDSCGGLTLALPGGRQPIANRRSRWQRTPLRRFFWISDSTVPGRLPWFAWRSKGGLTAMVFDHEAMAVSGSGKFPTTHWSML